MLRFGDKQPLDRLQQAAQDWKFQATLKPRLDVAEADWHAKQPPPTPSPLIVEHPVDPAVQTGDSLLLGGPISIHAPWLTDEQPGADQP